MSVRPHGTSGFQMGEFLLNLIYAHFAKICRENSKLHKNLRRITDNLHEDTTALITISRVILRKITNISDRTFGQNQNAFSGSLTFFRKSCPLCDNMRKSGSAGQATTDNMAHAYCMMDT